LRKLCPGREDIAKTKIEELRAQMITMGFISDWEHQRVAINGLPWLQFRQGSNSATLIEEVVEDEEPAVVPVSPVVSPAHTPRSPVIEEVVEEPQAAQVAEPPMVTVLRNMLQQRKQILAAGRRIGDEVIAPMTEEQIADDGRVKQLEIQIATLLRPRQ